MLITIYRYRPIDTKAGFEMECRINSFEDVKMLQELFVDLCCGYLGINDILMGNSEENNSVDSEMDYEANIRFSMVYDNIERRLTVFRQISH